MLINFLTLYVLICTTLKMTHILGILDKTLPRNGLCARL